MQNTNEQLTRINKKFREIKKWWKKYFLLDFFDSMNFLLFIIGSGLLIYCFAMGNVSLTDYISAQILFLTFIAILQYTKETYWLKQIQQKQLQHERKLLDRDERNSRLSNTLVLIKDFNNNVKVDLITATNPEYAKKIEQANLSSEELKNIIIYGRTSLEHEKNFTPLDNVLSFFEISGAELRENLIDFNLYYSHFKILFPRVYGNQTITNVIQNLLKEDQDSFSQLLFLKSEFEKELNHEGNIKV
ncbi:MAG: hypothetical protein WC080_00460 [Patescibacteria group bacterium]|jgi:hypothetical protein